MFFHIISPYTLLLLDILTQSAPAVSVHVYADEKRQTFAETLKEITHTHTHEHAL